MLCMKGLREELDRRGINVELVADEWCNTTEDVIYFCDNKAGHMAQIKTPDLGGINNTIEAVLYCKEHGFGAYQGRYLQRDRPFLPGMRRLRNGYPARPDPCKTRYGR